MLGLGRHTDYASRVLLHLATRGNNTLTTVKEIADQRVLPAPFVRRVVGRLARTGLLETVRGAGGGVRLARPSREIFLLDVVNAMENHIVLNRCVCTPAACPLSDDCPVRHAWTRATRTLESHMAEVSFADLARRLKKTAGQGRNRAKTKNRLGGRQASRSSSK